MAMDGQPSSVPFAMLIDSVPDLASVGAWHRPIRLGFVMRHALIHAKHWAGLLH